MKVLWTPNAEKGYDEIIKHLAEKWSPKEINNFVEETRDCAELCRSRYRCKTDASNEGYC